MDLYDTLHLIGEGTYGVVIKCRHKDSDNYVAIKRFKETDDDALVRKTALREIRMLKKLRFVNVVTLLEAFRRGGRYYLVFEYLEKTVLEMIEENQQGMTQETVIFMIWQVLKGLEFLHTQTVVHRDIKPENLLISANGSLKIADFGFARCLESDITLLTEYVSTRWYRAPELLVGYPNYGHAVDIWAVGCLYYEMRTAQPLFPGNSDLDMIARIVRGLGALPAEQANSFACNPIYRRHKLPMPRMVNGEWSTRPQPGPTLEIDAILERSCLTAVEADFVKQCLTLQPSKRPTAGKLLEHPLLALSAEALERRRLSVAARDETVIGPFRDHIRRIRAEQARRRHDESAVEPLRPPSDRSGRSPQPRATGQFDLPSISSVKRTDSTGQLDGPKKAHASNKTPVYKPVSRKNPTPTSQHRPLHPKAQSPDHGPGPAGLPGVSLPQVSQRVMQFGSGPVPHMHGYNLPGNALKSKHGKTQMGGNRASRKQKHRATPEEKGRGGFY
ncbi:Protein kinase domain [Carpediemonas membranifera]|uniref:cyclin-dependent kinase n=1 Tax=Carpediemonas membranifera TaxID=201153 RepID=A0A8J6C0H6_9EUKA|nr:Protein kinase domain [Carpediemonas membranifera]|eukprot:KAG9396591.1 Protein kinase domain [Carpediemonas membranifera]